MVWWVVVGRCMVRGGEGVATSPSDSESESSTGQPLASSRTAGFADAIAAMSFLLDNQAEADTLRGTVVFDLVRDGRSAIASSWSPSPPATESRCSHPSRTKLSRATS